MLIRVIARVREMTEDHVLQNQEPPDEVYTWKVKYVRSEDIEDFEEIEKKKTVIFFYSHRAPMIIRETPDDFFVRWKEAYKEDNKKEEEELEIEIEELDEDNETN